MAAAAASYVTHAVINEERHAGVADERVLDVKTDENVFMQQNDRMVENESPSSPVDKAAAERKELKDRKALEAKKKLWAEVAF